MKNTIFLHRLLLAGSVAVLASIATTGCTAGATTGRAPSTAEVAVPTTPRLDGADNFRDIGGLGAGYPTAGGGHVKRGVVYRSNALTLTDHDLEKLKGLGISQVIDFRTADEIAQKPDTAIPRAAWKNEDVLASSDSVSSMPDLTTPAAADAMMTSVYRSMVSSASARAAIGDTLKRIASGHGATILHCTAGKDRTGWTSALLLSVAGVDRGLIDMDYLLTNQYSRAQITAALAGARAQGGDALAAVYAPLLGVQKSFLDAAFSAAERQYGSIDGYLTDGLGLSTATIAELRSRLTA